MARASLPVIPGPSSQRLDNHGLEGRASAPVKAFDQEGASPFQANVTGLKSTVVTAFPGCVILSRPDAIARLDRALSLHPVTALLGPRQCGKTTLARTLLARRRCEFFDLENPVDMQRLSAPMTTLEKLSGLIIIDEVQ